MRVILLGDVHAFARRLPWRHWFSKCAAGWLNMRFNPNRKFNFDLWPGTLQYIRTLQPDWVLGSGDLTQLALPVEFTQVLEPWRQILGQPRTWIVPGNHDRYTLRSVTEQTFEQCVGDWAPASYPAWVKLSEHWYVLALDTTSTPSLDATGAVGTAQLQAIASELSRFTAQDGLLVLTHYPMLLPDARHDKPGHLLRDAQALRQVLAQSPARLIYLHGHVHEPWSWRCTEEDLPRLHCLNAGCPTRCSPAFPQGQGFWELILPSPGETAAQGNQSVILRRHRRVQDQWRIEQTVI